MISSPKPLDLFQGTCKQCKTHFVAERKEVSMDFHFDYHTYQGCCPKCNTKTHVVSVILDRGEVGAGSIVMIAIILSLIFSSLVFCFMKANGAM